MEQSPPHLLYHGSEQQQNPAPGQSQSLLAEGPVAEENSVGFRISWFL